MTDTVLRPKHYIQGSHECIDEIKAMLTPDEFRGFLKGNVIKYRYRANLKNGKEDLEKADNYAYYLINGHFKRAEPFSEEELNAKDKIALFKLNDLLEHKSMAEAVFNLLNQKVLSEDTTKTLKKIVTLVDFKNSEWLPTLDCDYARFVFHFIDNSKIILYLNQPSNLESVFTTKRINSIELYFLL